MSILTQLACALNRNDEAPNQALAQRIAEHGDADAVQELIVNLNHSNKAIQSDCIKVLYEIGERQPELISPHWQAFRQLLHSRDNRMVWGAMTALDSIAGHASAEVYGVLDEILSVANVGSVITKDHAVGILCKLAQHPEYAARCMPLLLKQLVNSPNNQFPMYAEKAAVVIDGAHRARFYAILAERVEVLEKESQKKRVLKVMRKVG